MLKMQLWLLQSRHQSQTTENDCQTLSKLLTYEMRFKHTHSSLPEIVSSLQKFKLAWFVSNNILIAFFKVINALVFNGYYQML